MLEKHYFINWPYSFYFIICVKRRIQFLLLSSDYSIQYLPTTYDMLPNINILIFLDKFTIKEHTS